MVDVPYTHTLNRLLTELTTPSNTATFFAMNAMNAMNARALLNERVVMTEDSFAELVVWHIESPPSSSAHAFKYRLALVVAGICVLRYDNEAGKGDHKHVGQSEVLYEFESPDVLLSDFWKDVDRWRREHEYRDT